MNGSITRISFSIAIAIVCAFANCGLLAQEETGLPKTVVELMQLRQQLAGEMQKPELPIVDRINLQERIVEIESAAIDGLNSGEKSFLAGAEQIDPVQATQLLENDLVTNRFVLSQMYQTTRQFSKGSETLEKVIAGSVIVYGKEHWKTREFELKLQVAQWLENSDEEKVGKFFEAKDAMSRAQSAFATKDFETAATAFRQSISLLEALELQVSMEYGESVANLPEAYAAANRPDEAEPLFLNAIEVNDQLFNKKSTVNANMRRSLSEVYRLAGRPSQALAVLEEAEPIYQTISQAGSIDWAYSLYLKAMNQSQLQKYVEAARTFFDSFEMMASLGQEDSPLVTELRKLSYNVYRKLNSETESVAAANKAVEIASQMFGQEQGKAASWLTMTADFEKSIGENERCLQLYLQAKASFEQTELFEQNVSYIKCLNSVALANYALDNKVDAIVAAEKATDLAGQLAGKQSMFYAVRAQNLAFFYTMNGNHDKAELLFSHLIPYLVSELGEDNLDFLHVLNDRAENLFRGNQVDAAIAEWVNLKSLQLENENVPQPELVRTLNSLLMAYEQKGDTDSAAAIKAELEKLGG